MLGLTAETADGPFVEPASRVQWVDKLLHLTRFSEFTLVLEGLEGVGKTTLLRQLRPTEHDSTLKLTEVTLSANTDTSELLKQIVSKLPDHSRQGGDDRARLQYLYSYGQALRNAGQHWVLAVDEAQHLSPQALDILLNFMIAHHGDGQPPQLLLSGTPVLGSLLSNSHIATSQSGRIHRMLMEPLTPVEAGLYLQRKFPAVAKQSEKQRQKLIAEAGGLPAELDRLATMLMHTGKVGAGRKPVAMATAPLTLAEAPALANTAELGPEPLLNATAEESADPLAAIHSGGREAAPPVKASSARAFPLSGLQLGMVGTVLVAITGVAAWQFMPQGDDSAGMTEQGAESRMSMQLSLNVDEPVEVDTSAVKERSKARLELEKRLAAYENRAVNTAIVEPVVAPSDQPPLPVNRVITELTPAQDKPPVAPEVAQPTVVSQQPITAPAPVATRTVAVPPAVVAQPAPVVVKKPAAALVVAQPEARPKPVRNVVAAREDELLSWPSKGFTLQLQGSRASKSALDFIRKQADKSNFYYFTTIYKGGPWHVVVYGRYPSRETAMADVKNLPAALRRLKPWARTVSGVQSDIRKK